MKYTRIKYQLLKKLRKLWSKLESMFEYLGEAIFPRPITMSTISNLPRRINNSHDKYFSLFFYQNQQVKDLIKYLKHHDDYFLTKKLAKITYEEISCSEWYLEKILKCNGASFTIIAVPSNSNSFQKYGNRNHVRNFASQVAYLMKSPLLPEETVVKKNTRKQALLPRNERLVNLKDAFSIQESKIIYQKNIIIIDDVWTTGATLENLSLCLTEAGAKNVFAITIAH